MKEGIIMNKAYLDHVITKSHLDVVDRTDLPMVFAENISKMRVQRKFTQDDMAYLLGVGKQTYFRIESGTNASVNSEIALKAANIFKVPLMSLFGLQTDDVGAYSNYMKCTDHTKRVINSMMKADIKYQEQMAEFEVNDIITVLYFGEEMHDGMNFGGFLYKEFNISEYRNMNWYKDADCILEINSNAYHPLYHIGDKLVICSRTPLDGEIGVFLKGSQFFLRMNKNSLESTYLLPVAYYENNPYPEIIVNRRNPVDMNQYTKFGTVIAVI